MTSLLALGCQRRILLTGTPVQNNLDEFFGKCIDDSLHMIPCPQNQCPCYKGNAGAMGLWHKLVVNVWTEVSSVMCREAWVFTCGSSEQSKPGKTAVVTHSSNSMQRKATC